VNHRDEAFTDFVREQRGGLVRSAMLLSGDRHRAEDLVQATLVKLYLAWDRIPPGVHAYARRVMVNAFIDERRRPFFRRERLVDRVPEPEPGPADGGGNAVQDAAWAALARLPPRMRAAVILRHVDGLTVAETADALGCEEGTVKSQTSRGLALLREGLTCR
jgi:RNA polymerase sigma-70 factor (sigma-E family)